MPLTVGQVAALPELGLLARTEDAPLDREVRWVAVSEHRDPTPWLEGGDLLLTTGMSIVDDADAAREYVERLIAADVAALGFGVGLAHDAIPAALVSAAEDAGLPLLEVPRPVPFVAVSKAVSRLLSAEEYAESAASFETQRRLIRSTTTAPADAGVVPVVARHVAGFALHLDGAGRVLVAHPAAAAARADALAAEIERLRPKGLLASAAISSADEHVVILPIGVRGAADGFLVVGSSRPLRNADQAVLNLAVSLMSWQGSRTEAADDAMDGWRRLLVSVAREHGLDPQVLHRLGLAGLTPAHGVAVCVRGASGRPVPDAVLVEANRGGAAVLCRSAAGTLEGFAAVDDAGQVGGAVRALVGVDGVHAIGLSCVLDLSDPVNVRQALEQAERAAALGPGLQEFADEPARGLASLIDAATTVAWAEGYLGGLPTAAEGPELMDTLRAWLDQHGQVDATAQRLGIHRHTVRHRLRRAEAALGRSLDDPAVRADLWFALEAVRPVAPEGDPDGRG